MTEATTTEHPVKQSWNRAHALLHSTNVIINKTNQPKITDISTVRHWLAIWRKDPDKLKTIEQAIKLLKSDEKFARLHEIYEIGQPTNYQKSSNLPEMKKSITLLHLHGIRHAGTESVHLNLDASEILSHWITFISKPKKTKKRHRIGNRPVVVTLTTNTSNTSTSNTKLSKEESTLNMPLLTDVARVLKTYGTTKVNAAIQALAKLGICNQDITKASVNIVENVVEEIVGQRSRPGRLRNTHFNL